MYYWCRAADQASCHNPFCILFKTPNCIVMTAHDREPKTFSAGKPKSRWALISSIFLVLILALILLPGLSDDSRPDCEQWYLQFMVRAIPGIWDRIGAVFYCLHRLIRHLSSIFQEQHVHAAVIRFGAFCTHYPCMRLRHPAMVVRKRQGVRFR